MKKTRFKFNGSKFKSFLMEDLDWEIITIIIHLLQIIFTIYICYILFHSIESFYFDNSFNIVDSGDKLHSFDFIKTNHNSLIYVYLVIQVVLDFVYLFVGSDEEHSLVNFTLFLLFVVFLMSLFSDYFQLNSYSRDFVKETKTIPVYSNKYSEILYYSIKDKKLYKLEDDIKSECQFSNSKLHCDLNQTKFISKIDHQKIKKIIKILEERSK